MSIEITVEPEQLIRGEEAELVLSLHNSHASPCTNIVFGFRLPFQIVLLRGSRRLRLPRLEGGSSYQHQLTVLPKEEGQFALHSGNCSYRDSRGRAQRISSFEVPLEVVAPSPEPVPAAPDLRISVRTGEVPLEEWVTLEVELANEGDGVAHQTTLNATGRIDTDPVRVPDLRPHDVVQVELPVRALEPGRVPVRFEAKCRGPGKTLVRVREKEFLDVFKPPAGENEQGDVHINVTDSTIGEFAPNKEETHMGDVVSIQRKSASSEDSTPFPPQFCAKCGYSLTDMENAKFCPQCGERIGS